MVTHPIDGAEGVGGGEAAKEKKKEKKKKPKDGSDADDSGRCVNAAATTRDRQQPTQLHERDAARFSLCVNASLEAPHYRARPLLANHKTQHLFRHFFTFFTKKPKRRRRRQAR